jgi:hypothetical protein
MAYEKNPDELGALWEKNGSKGPYLTGEINGVKVVAFPVERKSDKSPAWRVLKSKPREDAPVQRERISDDDIAF